MSCRHIGHVSATGQRVCGLISDRIGLFKIAVSPAMCKACEGAGWNQTPLQNGHPLWLLYLKNLHVRFVAGDCPKHHVAKHPVDMGVLFDKIVADGGNDVAEGCLSEAVRYQGSLSEGQGGDSPETVADKMTALAEPHGFGYVLEEAILRHGQRIEEAAG